MKATKLIKKSALCLLLAEALFFTELPVLAESPVQSDNTWESDEEEQSGWESENEELQPQDGFSDDAGADSMEFESLEENFDQTEELQSQDLNELTQEEIEAQLAPIRQLQPGSYVDPPEGNGSGEIASYGARAISYPAKFDPRSSLGLAVRNQKPSNMCWAYTLATNLEISFLRAGAGLFDLSEEHLAYFFAHRTDDPLGNTPNDRNNVGHSYREGGNQTLATLFLSSWSGMALESEVPYETNADHTLDSNQTPAASTAYHTAAYLENAAFSTYSVNNIKELITEYGSVSLSFGMYDSYYNPYTYAYSYPNSAGVNHAVTLIGWDDSFSKNNFNEVCGVSADGAWIARNSWGDSWGDGGYFYISYENKSNYNIVAAEAITSPKYKNNYFYDGSCALSKLKLYPSGSGKISSVANVFEAKAGNGKGEAIGEVVLETYTDGGNYGIQIYTNLEDKDDPTSGTPAYSTPVQFYQEHAGISTVSVPEVSLLGGTLYSVVVTNMGSGTVEYLCETNSSYDWVSFQADLKEKQSFCYHEKNGWTDFAKTSPSACARIKAHTRTLDSALAVGKPSSLKGTVKAYNEVTLTWETVSGATGYQIYRKAGSGKYTKVGTVSWDKTSFSDKNVVTGTSYTYRIRAYAMVNGTANYSGYSSAVTVKPVLSVPKVSVSVSPGGYNTVKWTKTAGATGYLVYRKSGKSWTKLKTVKGAVTYEDAQISSNTVYEYMVRAYRTVNKKVIKSSYKSSGKYKSAPARQAVSSVTNVKTGLKLRWKAQKKCDGYYIYRKTGSGSYKRVKTLKKGSSSSWTDRKTVKGKKYRYRIMAYVKEPDGTVIKGRYRTSSAVTRTK